MPSKEACATLQSRLSALAFAYKKLRRSHPDQRAAMALLRVIEKNGQIRASDLAQQLAVDTSTVSRQVDHLVNEGYVTRVAEQGDGRANLLTVTRSGHKALAKQFDVNTAEMREQLHDWSDQDILTFALLLERFENSLSSISKLNQKEGSA